MAKIVIDAREYTTSTGRYMFRLLQYLEKIDHENHYLILLKPEDMNIYAFSNPNFSKIPTPFREFSFGEQIGLAKQLYTLKADLVHFGMVQQPILYLKRTVTTIHDLTTLRFTNPAKNPVVFKVKQFIYAIVIWVAAHKSKQIIVASNYVKKDLLDYANINPAKITITSESADRITDAPESLQNLIDKPFLMYIGRPTPHKNLWRLIKAFDQLKEKHPDLVLALAGKLDANYQSIQTKVQEAGIKNVVFCGLVSEGQLRWLYEHCRAYVFPSLSEGFGLPGLEAMAHGAPVVSSQATCLPEIYGDGAIYFNPIDIDDMAQTIDKVLSGEQLRQKLIRAGSKRLEIYSWEKMAQETLAVYNKALSN